MASLGRTDLDVFPICLGGNVFGWTADEPQSRAVLDAYVGAGGKLHRHRKLLWDLAVLPYFGLAWGS